MIEQEEEVRSEVRKTFLLAVSTVKHQGDNEGEAGDLENHLPTHLKDTYYRILHGKLKSLPLTKIS